MTGAMSSPARRGGAAAALVAVVAALAVAVPPLAVRAGSLVCSVPRIDQVSPSFGHTGDGVTVTGSFGSAANAACTTGLSVGGTPVTLTSTSNSQLTFTSPGANGAVVATLTDLAGASNSSNSNLVYGTVPTVAGLSPGNPTEGQAIGISGSGFTFRTATAALNPAVEATVLSGGSVCQGLGVLGIAETSITLAGPGRYCDGGIQLSFQLVVNTRTGAVASIPITAGAIDVAATVSSTSPDHGTPGTRVTVSGSGLGTGGAATLGGAAAAASWADHAVAVTIPAAADSGGIVLTRATDGAAIGAGPVTVDSQISSVSPPAAGVGETVTITGRGFGSQRGVVHLGTADPPIGQWSPTAITVTVPAGVPGGTLTVVPTVNTPSTAGLAIVPRLTGVSPGHALVGAPVVVSGTSLGSRTGSVSVGGRAALVTLWADEQVGFTIPDGVRAGHTSISVAAPGAPPASIAFTVDPGSLSPEAKAAALAATGITPPPIPPPPGGPLVTHGGTVDFHPQRKPPSPINLTLVPARDQADPGSDVDLTGTLIAYGRPVPGATVEMLLVVEPGTDATIEPARSVTNSRGQVHGRLHLSATAGDHILLARSGLYSDEIRVRGGSDTALAGTSGVVQRSVFWAVAGALMLFVLGLAINLATSPGVAVAGAVAWRQRPPGPRGLAIGGGRVAWTVLRSAASGWRAGAARLAARAGPLIAHRHGVMARVRRRLFGTPSPPL